MPEFIHSGEEKKRYVRKMFNDIAPRYDLLNHLLSLGIDFYWRRKLVSSLNLKDGEFLLDAATGTGDVCFAALKRHKIFATGIDCSSNMIQIASIKANRRGINNIEFIKGDAEYLPFHVNKFDALSIAFGFRNIGHYEKAISEFNRVLKPGGRLAILDFSIPQSKIFSFLYRFYFLKILPKIARLFSRADAYRYLPESVENFPSRKKVTCMLEDAGFKKIEVVDLTFGIVSIFTGLNKSDQI